MKKLWLVLLACLCVGTLSACKDGKEEQSSSVHSSVEYSTSSEENSSLEESISTSEESTSEEDSSSEVHTHNWDDGKVTIAPTCEEKGVKTYSCACGESYTEDISALGHTFVNDECACGKKVSVGLEYTLNEDNVSYSVTGIGTCTDTDLVIPSMYDGLPVTSIGSDAFYGCTSLTSVEIGDSVTSIGEVAFLYCTALTSIKVSDNNIAYQSIDGNLYTKNGKTLIQYAIGKTDMLFSIPNSVTSIGDGAFYGCDALTSVEIGDSVTSIGVGAFESCDALTSVEIGDSVASIGNYAFLRCTSLTSVEIGDSVTSIGLEAFSNTAYYNDENNWENNVLYIGKYFIEAKNTMAGECTIKDDTLCIADRAFSGCKSLINIIVSENNTAYQSIDGNLYTKDGKTLIQYAIGKTGTLFTIPDSVASIGDDAFAGCDSLTSVVIPDSVTSIGSEAFFRCTSLTSVEIGDSVASIGRSAFADCTSLTSVEIGDSVTSIGWNAFYHCTSLTTVVIGDSVTSIGLHAFIYCESLTTVVIGDSVTSIGAYAFADCYDLEEVYFKGSAEEWNMISIDDYNSDLTEATRYYYTEEEPAEAGNWWHYVNGKPTVW